MLDLLIVIPRPPLSRSFFSLSVLLVLPLRPTEERAGHKSGAIPARDCNPTGYIMFNRVPLYMCALRSRPVRSTSRNGIAAIGDTIDRSFYAY